MSSRRSLTVEIFVVFALLFFLTFLGFFFFLGEGLSFLTILFSLSAGATFGALGSFLALRRFSQEVRRLIPKIRDEAVEISEIRSPELVRLVVAIERVAKSYRKRISEIERRAEEEQAVLSGMVEGVIAVDTQQRILRMNDSALRLLGVERVNYLGKNLEEIVRSYSLHCLVARVLEEGRELEGEMILPIDGEDHFLEFRGNILRGVQDGGIGAMLVIRDVTRMKKLEELRREFVANVSHELRTPITSIKSSVETLLEGALDDRNDAERFLNIINKQVNGLIQLIDDLLTLSKLDGEREEIQTVEAPLRPIVENALELCRGRAESKQIELAVKEVTPGLTARVHPSLMEQAIVNLIDNAIKYSDDHKQVTVYLNQEDGDAVLAVNDQGWGIRREHLGRIFERFYRVEKARSRKLGGTGLGLAIVKHVARAHRGQVMVESEMGAGSTFFVRWPLAESRS